MLANAAQPPFQWGGLLMPILLIAIFYFMFIRPQQRKEKERRKMIDELRAGAKIIFAGGIIGTIVEANEKSFIVETTDGRMEVLRACVQGVFEEPAADKK
jgi:preprotein translocase subunit YajC